MGDTLIILGGALVLLWVGLGALVWVGGFDRQIGQIRQGLGETRNEVSRQLNAIRQSVDSVANAAKSSEGDYENLNGKISDLKRELDLVRAQLNETQNIAKNLLERFSEKERKTR